MHSTWYLSVLTACTTVAELILIAIMARRGSWRRWPFLFGFVVVCLLRDGLLAATFHHYAAYFYSFYASNALLSLAELLILVDITRSFPGAEFLGFSVPVFFGSAASVIAAGAAYLSTAAGSIFAGDPGMRLVHLAQIVQRATAFALVAYLVAFLLSVKLLHLGWSRKGTRVCHGLAVTLLGGLPAACMISLLPRPYRLAGDALAASCTLAGLVMWCFSLQLPEERYELPSELKPVLSHLYELPVEKVG